jgi:hypothetical protein
MGCFQRLSEASSLWREAVGKGYEDFLDTKELFDLRMLFQRRHLLMHRDGVVDADYIQKSADHDYAIGQRIIVREGDVFRLVFLVGKLRDELRKYPS